MGEAMRVRTVRQRRVNKGLTRAWKVVRESGRGLKLIGGCMSFLRPFLPQFAENEVLETMLQIEDPKQAHPGHT